MYLSACILYSLLVLTSCSEFNDRVFNNLVRLCPGQYVPTDNGTLLNQTSEFDSCCTDNFSNLTSTTSVLNKTSYTTDGQSCLFPSTYVMGETGQKERSYFMITDPPKDGCLLPDNDTKTTKGTNINHPTCDDSEVSPFRRFLPVYSKSSGFVYKNPHCASCHGQYDGIPWTTLAYCRIHSAFSFGLEDCVFQFEYPGDHDDIQHLECFTDYYSACPVDTIANFDKFREVTDLSVNELTNACSMDNLPRFEDTRLAKNVFCYICHYCENGCKFPRKSCRPAIRDTPRTIGDGFTRILDSRLVSQLRTDHETVCEMDQDERVCHELLCPLGQALTFSGLEKTCQMDSTQWTAQRFSVLLLLEFENSIDVHLNNLETILTQTQSPWPRSWYLEILYQPFARNADLVRVDAFLHNVTKAIPVNSINHMYIQLTYRRTTVNPVVLLRELEKLLAKSAFFAIAGKRHRARQSLGKSTLKTLKAELSPGEYTQIISMPVWQLLPDVKPYNRWLYKPILITTNRKPAFLLNKLMLCKQVELTSANFDMITHTITISEELVMLYYNRTGHYLYDNEFRKVSGRNGEQSFRLCISDARLRSNESARHQISLTLLLLVTVIFTVL